MKNVYFVLFAIALTACAGGDPDVGNTPCPVPMGTGGNGGDGDTGGVGGNGGNASCVVCEAPVIPDPDTIAGTRLTPQWLIGSDGSRMRFGNFWTDTEYNDETCSFQLLPDGQTRCLPPHEKINSYADANCIVPVYVQLSSCNPPAKFARVDELDYNMPGVCGAKYVTSQLYALGDEIAGATKYYAKNPSGACTGLFITADMRAFYLNAAPKMDFFVERVPSE